MLLAPFECGSFSRSFLQPGFLEGNESCAILVSSSRNFLKRQPNAPARRSQKRTEFLYILPNRMLCRGFWSLLMPASVPHTEAGPRRGDMRGVAGSFGMAGAVAGGGRFEGCRMHLEEPKLC